MSTQSGDRTLYRRNLNMLALSIVILICGMVWSYRVGLEANLASHEAFHAQEDLEGMQADTRNIEARIK